MKPSDTLEQHRDAIRAIVQAHRAGNPRVFGSALHGQDTDDSDLDILIDPEADMSLFDIGAIRWKLHDLLGVRVDVVSPGALPEGFRDAVVRSAKPI